MKNLLLIIFCLLVSSCSLQSQLKIESTSIIPQLDLTCQPIPNNNFQICSLETLSEYGPFDDVVFYKRDQEGYLTLLSSQKSYGQTFGSIEFSEKGKYLYLSWAEEGHPQFHFYLTSKFLESGLSSDLVGFLEDYYLVYIKSFSDDGQLIYLADKQTNSHCRKTIIEEDFSYCLISIKVID